MRRSRVIVFVCMAVMLMLLSGCVSIIEEITIREDGSGTLRIALGVDPDNYEAFQEAIPEGFDLENLFSVLGRDENVTSVDIDRYFQDGRNWETVELTVADFTAVFGQTRRIGPITITFQEEDESYRFTQTIDLASSTLVIPGVNLMDLSDGSYGVSLTTPQIISTNGVQPSAGVSTWSIPLDEVLQGGSTVFLRADYLLEPYEGVFIPWELFFPYVVIGFLALGGIAVLVVILVNTTGKRDQEPTLKF